MAASKKPSQTRPVALEKAVEEIASNLQRLTTRLIGDEMMQAKGLVQEVDDLRRKAEDGFAASAEAQRHTTAALEKLTARMEGFEQFKLAQEAANKKFEDTAEQIDKAKNIAFGSCKALSIAATVLITCSGGIGWLAGKYFQDQQPAAAHAPASVPAKTP